MADKLPRDRAAIRICIYEWLTLFSERYLYLIVGDSLMLAAVYPRRADRPPPITSIVVVVVALLLVGCSNGSESTANDPSVAETCEERLAPDEERAAALEAQWSARPGFDDLYSESPLKPQAVRRCIRPDEYGRAISSCLQEAGFDAGLTPDGEGVLWANIPAEQQTAAFRAGDECDLAYPVDPIYMKPLDSDQLEIVYEHLVQVTLPCLAKEGYKIDDPPSLSVFVESYGTSATYSPYNELVHAEVNIAPLLDTCPELPPLDDLWSN